VRQSLDHILWSIPLTCSFNTQKHASVSLIGRIIQERDPLCRTEGNEDKYSGTQCNLDILDSYNPSLLWTFPPHSLSPSFSSLSENSSFHIYCSLKASTDSPFNPTQGELKFCSRHICTAGKNLHKPYPKQTVYTRLPTLFSIVKMTFK